MCMWNHLLAKCIISQLYDDLVMSNKASRGFRPLCQIGSLLEALIIKNVEVICWLTGCTATMQKVDDPSNCALFWNERF